MGKARWWLLAVLAVVVLAGLATYGDLGEMARSLTRFPFQYLLAALGLAGLNYLLRFLRWSCLLRALDIRVSAGSSLLVFLSGLALSITPGKVGELVKSYLLRDRAGVPVASSAPVVVMERLTDAVAVVLLGLAGLVLPASRGLPRGVLLALVAVLLGCGVVVLLVASRRGDWLLGLPGLRRWRGALGASRDGLRRLLSPGPLSVAMSLAALAWLSEGVALWVLLRGLDVPLSVMQAVPIYAAATLAGAITALPGGLVGTEGSMVALLQQAGVARGPASAATLLVRLATLWFAVGIGLAALAILHRRRAAGLPRLDGMNTNPVEATAATPQEGA
ncbi:MAG: flippase-like domain-containing protein [Dehalococcoidia bacterium]|nr:flippase-like domain-containing protein [Dehalococcoidia bacterium]MSQ16800.1 flippase-like domain-containing protein [Dehalococcoidia bacterium]